MLHEYVHAHICADTCAHIHTLVYTSVYNCVHMHECLHRIDDRGGQGIKAKRTRLQLRDLRLRPGHALGSCLGPLFCAEVVLRGWMPVGITGFRFFQSLGIWCVRLIVSVCCGRQGWQDMMRSFEMCASEPSLQPSDCNNAVVLR